jgi:hypothetical protein
LTATQLARFDVLQHRGCANGGGVQAAGQQVGQLRACAAIGHMHDEQASGGLQVFHRQMTSPAVAG